MHLNNNVVIFSHQRRKRLENAQDFFAKTKTETKTCVYVLEAPRDQDLGLEDYITDNHGAQLYK